MNFVSKIKCKIKENLFSIFQTTLIDVLILLVVAFVVVLFSEDPKWSFKLFGVSESENPKYEVLKFLGIGMGGILVALQALMSYKRAKAMEDTASHTEQGLRQERLKNAIEHLGNEKDSVRMGGAYELFHLAEDNKDLRKTAFDILCAHIRQTTGESEYQKKHESKPSEEVQSLLTLLFVQNHEVFKGLQINLQGSWLNGADLRKARLQGVILTGAYLQRAKLDGTHLQKADLREAHLQGATLVEAYLQRADLNWAHLPGSTLARAHLQKAELSMAHLQGASLYRAHLQGAGLLGTYLQKADLREAHLQGAFLLEPHLQGADLGEADLRGVESRVWGGPPLTFAQYMRASIGKETDLSTVIFEGGLRQEYVENLICLLGDKYSVESLSHRKVNELREKLEPHIDKPISNELPEDSGAITGAYTAEEAEEWIAEYEKALSEVPEKDR